MRDIVILGSTGSIGVQALEVIAANPDRFQVVALAAGKYSELLEKQKQDLLNNTKSEKNAVESILQTIQEPEKVNFPFKISFVLQDFEDRQKEFNLPKPTEFSDLLAEVFKPEPLVLKLKNEAENQIIGYRL